MRHMLRPPTRLQLAEWQATSFMLNVSIHCSSAASPEGKVQLCLIKNSCLLRLRSNTVSQRSLSVAAAKQGCTRDC